MKTSIDNGLMLVFLACLFACCACEEAKDEKFLLRGGALSTIGKITQERDLLQQYRTCVSYDSNGNCTQHRYHVFLPSPGIVPSPPPADYEPVPWPTPKPAPTPPTPPTGPGGHDEPHLYTWYGIMYDYHGQCDLIYTTCPSFDDNKGLHIHLRTEFVLPRKWSTISSMAVKLGEDVFEIQNNGTYYVNGEADTDLTDTTNLSGHKLIHKTTSSSTITRNSFTVLLGEGMSLIMTRSRTSAGRNSISFNIRGVHNHRNSGGTSLSDCVGLTSTWDHDPNDEKFLIGRSGNRYASHEAVDFGPEWQVDLTKGDPMLFYENIGQHLPDQSCIDSPLQAKDQRHLKKLHAAEGGALARQAEEACSHLDGGGNLFDACFFDVLVTGDVTFAQEPWYNEGE